MERIIYKIKLAFKVLFNKRSAIVFFEGEPTEGDSITVGKMKAIFKKSRI